MKRFLFIILLIVILGGSGYLYFKGHSGTGSAVGDMFGATRLPNTNETPATKESNLANYSDPNFHFALKYPNGLDVHEYDEGDGSRTVAFEGDSPGLGFQVYVLPYSGKAITDKQFRKDDPSGVMKEPQNIVMDGAPAKIFFGRNAQMGDTREVWTIHGGFLYEVTTYKALDDWLGQIMLTWHFI